jgi:hypothetical protein
MAEVGGGRGRRVRPETGVAPRAGARVSTGTKTSVDAAARALALAGYHDPIGQGGEPRFDPDDVWSADRETEIPFTDEDAIDGDEPASGFDTAPLMPLVVDLRVWVDPVLRQVVSEAVPPARRVLLDDRTRTEAVKRWQRLQGYADELKARLSVECLTATTLAEVHRLLPPLAFGTSRAVGAAQVSREHRETVVGIPQGTVALGFFYSKTPSRQGGRNLVAEMAAALLELPDLPRLSNAELGRRFPGLANVISKQGGAWCRAAVVHRPLVEAAAARWLADPRYGDEQIDDLARSILRAWSAAPESVREQIGAIGIETDNRHRQPLWRAVARATEELA